MGSSEGKSKNRVQMVLQVTPELKDQIQKTAADLGMPANAYVAFVMHNHFRQQQRLEPMMERIMDQLPAEIGKALREHGEDSLDLLAELRKAKRKKEV